MTQTRTNPDPDSYQKQMRGLSVEGRQQGWKGRRGQEGSSRAGEGGGAAVITKGLWVVAVNKGGVAGHRGRVAAQRFTPEAGGVDVRGELLGGWTEVGVGDEGTPHAVVAGQHVRPCREPATHQTFITAAAQIYHTYVVILRMCRHLSQNVNWVQPSITQIDNDRLKLCWQIYFAGSEEWVMNIYVLLDQESLTWHLDKWGRSGGSPLCQNKWEWEWAMRPGW